MSTETNHTEFDRELLSAYVDGELTSAERAAVEAQLASDPAATRQVEEFRRLSGIIQGLPRPTLPADFSAKVLQRADQTQAETNSEPLRPGVSLGRSWRGWLWASAALAAALLIMVALPQQPREMARVEAPDGDDQRAKDGGLRNSRGEGKEVVVTASRSAAEVETNAVETNTVEELAAATSATSSRMSITDSLESDSASAALGSIGPEPRLLIVRVSMPPEALAKRELDRVFARNDIDVELASESESLGDEKAVDRARNAAGGEGRRLDSYAFGLPESREGKDADAEEVVLVEAPEEQILACLETMKQDSANFHSVEVETDSPLLKLESAQKKVVQDKWQRFNRGEFAKLAEQTRKPTREAFAPPENAPPENEPPEDTAPPPPSPVPPSPAPTLDALPSAAGEADAARPEPQEQPQDAVAESNKNKDPKSLASKGKAYRYWKIDEPQKRALTDLSRRRQLKQEAVSGRGGFGGGVTIADGKQPLQVLFVVQDAPPAVAAPALEEASPPPAESTPE